MSGYQKLNTSLLNEKDFQGHLLLTLMQKLTEAVVWDKQWAHLGDVIRLFAADYSKRCERHKNHEEKVL